MDRPNTFIQDLKRELNSGTRSAIGFGCAHLYGGRQRAEAIVRVKTALEAGITYFDTARLYGHGASEGILGEAITGDRDRLIITSKAGILPVAETPIDKAFGKARAIANRLGALGRAIPMPQAKQPQFGVFSPVALIASVETSLKALGTDYIDVLLLHECGPADASAPELVEALQSLVKAGKIRAFGSATQPEHTATIAAGAIPGMDVLQFKNDALDQNLEVVSKQTTDELLITHSVLGGSLASLQAFAAKALENPASAAAQLGFDIEDRSAWARVLLGHALAANKDGIVLFSSTNPANIRASARQMPANASEVKKMATFIAQYRAFSAKSPAEALVN